MVCFFEVIGGETKKHSVGSASLKLWYIGDRRLAIGDRIVLLADHDLTRCNLTFLVLEEDVEERAVGFW